MDTIQQIQQKIYELQEKNRIIEKYHREVMLIQSDIDTLLIDLKYDFKIEQFIFKRA
jgi:2-C-methyl-D-erythritol 4-phosphate cytidylyltransferase